MQNRTDEIIAELKLINNRIHEKIRYPANRYEEVETFPRGMSLEAAKEKYDMHEHNLRVERQKFHFYQDINEWFEHYQKQRASGEEKIEELAEIAQIKTHLLSYLEKEFSLLRKQQMYVEGTIESEMEKVEDFLKDNLDNLVAKLCSGINLELEDKNLTERFQINEKLVAERNLIFKNHFSIQPEVLQQIQNEESQEKLIKTATILEAHFLDSTQVNIGYCGEYCSLAIKYILENNIFLEMKPLEEIVIKYSEDNHVMLAINRDPEKKLEDFPNWGEEAILFDPWNSLICKAKDFNTLPIQYLTYSDVLTWSVVAKYFNYLDKKLLTDVYQNQDNFLIVGLEDAQKRNLAIMEEYNLTSVDDSGLENLKECISQALRIASHNLYPIQFYVTPAGNAPIQVISGFNFPAVAIHKDYLLDLLETVKQGRDCSDEFLFGLASATNIIRNFPLGNKTETIELYLTKLDAEVMQRHRNGISAINYLRYCIPFIEKHYQQHDIQQVSLMDRHSRLAGKSSVIESYNNRIKNITTLLAVHELFREKGKLLPLSLEIEFELGRIKENSFFAKEFYKQKNNVEKINYLTSMLPELKKELIPFEERMIPSIRLREFCCLLKNIKTETEEKEIDIAINYLINQAFVQRTPGFELIYQDVLMLNSMQKPGASVQPYGVFNELQQTINEFMQATSRPMAVEAAKHLLRYRHDLSTHMEVSDSNLKYAANQHFQRFKKAHNRVPKEMERYFGSSIGKKITWKGFQLTKRDGCSESELPWNKYLDWIDPDDNDVIPEALWWLGVVCDKRLIAAMSKKTLEDFSLNKKPDINVGQLIEFEKEQLVDKDSSEKNLREIGMDMILTQLSVTHQIDFSMYDNPVLSFAEKFALFYDRNLFALMMPAKDRNSDNPAVRHLLKTFTQVALNGVEEDKLVVKQFFLSRDKNQRNLWELTQIARESMLSIYAGQKLDVPLYQKFCIDQEYEGIAFSLFSQEESFSIFGYYFYSLILDYKFYLRLSRFYENDVTYEVLLKILPIMFAHGIWKAGRLFIDYYFSRHSHFVLSLEFINLVKLTLTEFNWNRSDLLEQPIWKLPSSDLELKEIPVNDLILLYRAYDQVLLFPSIEKQKQFAQLIFHKISHMDNSAEKIEALEFLFFENPLFSLGLNDLQFCRQAIELWIENILKIYGEDNGEDDSYIEKLKTLIDKVFKLSFSRDQLYILTQLADTLLLQQELSDYIGIRLEPKKYVENRQDVRHKDVTDKQAVALQTLVQITKHLAKDSGDQQILLNFLMEPMTPASLREFSKHLLQHRELKKIQATLGFSSLYGFSRIGQIELMASTIYHLFWDRSINERALAMNYLLIPSTKMGTSALEEKAYQAAFETIIIKLFPDAAQVDSDDNLAKEFLTSYLGATNEYSRAYLLSGILVANNESREKQLSTGKKLALLCEHLGPAYVKLAQAIHSYPLTPPAIKKDLHHIKGRANPPTRWQLWRMIDQRLLVEDKKNIKYVGKLLGSASYNIALQVQQKNGSKIVLSMLRENAEQEAKQGFEHLTRAINACRHARLQESRSTILSLIIQAQALSVIEMNSELSAKQYQIAQELYQYSVQFDDRIVKVEPSKLLKAGKGYRFVEEAPGKEFNTLAGEEKIHPDLVVLAEAIVTIELHNIFRGGHFDSDRHGNQLRVEFDKDNKTIKAKLYDFGEMALEAPAKDEILQLADLVKSLSRTTLINKSFASVFEEMLSNQIKKLQSEDKSAKYLMHIRKGMLALQDFYQHLSSDRLMQILVEVFESREISSELAKAVPASFRMGYAIKQFFKPKPVSKIKLIRTKHPQFFSNLPAQTSVLKADAKKVLFKQAVAVQQVERAKAEVEMHKIYVR